MKLEYVNVHMDGDKAHVAVGVLVDASTLNVNEVIARFGLVPAQVPLGDSQTAVAGSDAPAGTSATTDAGGTEPPRRTRRTRAQMEADAGAAKNPTPPPASEPAADTSPSTAPVSRRLRAVTPPADPMPITDTELSKAASNGAEELVKLGEDGPALITLILGDYKVASVNELVGEAREAFIKAVNEEVRLAKEEKGA